MKSVLFINYEYPPIGGGAATATYHFAKEFASKNIKTSVLTSAYKDHRGTSKENNVTIFRIAALRTRKEKSSKIQMLCFMISAAFNLHCVIKKSNPDIVITFFSIPCGPIGLVARLLWKLPYVVMLRGGDVPGSERGLSHYHMVTQSLRRLIYKKSMMIFANSSGLKQIAEKADPGFTIHVIPNGVDSDFFSPGESSTTTVNKYFTFLFVGRICTQKNIGVLIKAFSECLSHHPEIKLVIAGDGPQQQHFKTLANTLNINNQIHWTGWQNRDRIKSLYLEADCLVNPSLNEGMPNVVLEAMACGMAVIASDCAGNKDLIISGFSGLLFPVDNQNELTRLMMLVLKNQKLRYEVGVHARDVCCKQYSWKSAAAQLGSVLFTKDC